MPSYTSVSRADWAPLLFIRAYGGTRRERGASIAAAVRRLKRDGVTLERYHTSYDEAYGFQTLTETRYRVR